MSDKTTQENDQITVNRAKYNSITLYEISEEELEIIERGSPSSHYLNFAIALLATCISFFIALTTTKIEDIKIYIIYVVITILSLIVGLILLALWIMTYKSSKGVFNKIRSRKNIEKIREITDGSESEPTTEQETDER